MFYAYIFPERNPHLEGIRNEMETNEVDCTTIRFPAFFSFTFTKNAFVLILVVVL